MPFLSLCFLFLYIFSLKIPSYFFYHLKYHFNNNHNKMMMEPDGMLHSQNYKLEYISKTDRYLIYAFVNSAIL